MAAGPEKEHLMAESAAYARRGYAGNAAPTTLSGSHSNSATTINGASFATWTTTVTNGPARATISDGVNEEQIEFTGVGATTLTGVTRGVGGTTAQSWTGGETISHTSSQRDFDEANKAVNQTLGLIAGNGSKGIRVNSGATSLEAFDVPELIRDTIGTALTAGSGISLTVDDAGDTITVAASASSVTAVGCRAYHSTTQSISTATLTAVVFDSEEFDTSSIHSTAVNTSRFTVPAGKSGKWQFTGNLVWAPNATGQRQALWTVNGVAQRGTSIMVVPSVTTLYQNAPTVTLNLSVGDYVQLFVYQDSGGNLNLNSGDTVATATFLGA
jgi:hypothetical protein